MWILPVSRWTSGEPAARGSQPCSARSPMRTLPPTPAGDRSAGWLLLERHHAITECRAGY
ncbi:hypothetical protein [Ornithinimicrobium kibberense]|uniref:hypothetical protein n=1 Tax=Ornithinimicrobium kibberense TaxID=282060 RepID=UPI00360CD1FD